MEIRDYQIEDETSWVRCRVLSFLDRLIMTLWQERRKDINIRLLNWSQ